MLLFNYIYNFFLNLRFNNIENYYNKYIYFTRFNKSKSFNMNKMFYDFQGLEKVNFNKIKIKEVTNICFTNVIF